MTELSFLIDLLLNHRLQKGTKEVIQQRIKDVEAGMAMPMQVPRAVAMPAHLSPAIAMQSPSTQALMAKHAAMGEPPPAPVKVEQIAQTPAAQAALASRQQAIAIGLSGKPAKGETSPRKF